MTQEEKAKAYDKALEIAKAWCKLDNNDLSNEDLETLFPELKESEDERIRKWCISHFKECINVIKDNDEYKEYLSNKVNTLKIMLMYSLKLPLRSLIQCRMSHLSRNLFGVRRMKEFWMH